jgi:hypothetical protein
MKLRLCLAAVAVPLALGAALAAGGPAAAATPAPAAYTASVGSIPVTVSASGTGAAAVVNAGDTLSLTVGSPAASTYAQAALTLPAGSVLPATAPTFVTDSAAAGSPRWVIVLANKDMLFNDQSGVPADTASASAADWESDTGSGWSAASTYQAAAARVGGAGQVVTQAYIVADGDQAAGTTDVISSVRYGGHLMTVRAVRVPRPYVYGGHVVTVANNTAVVGWSEGPGVQCELVRIWGYGFSASDGSPHVGYTCDTGHPGVNKGYLWGLAAGHTYFLQVIPSTVVGWGQRADARPLPGVVDARQSGIDLVTTR